MVQLAVIESSSNSLTSVTPNPVMTMKRKTPSELRSEQLKRSSQKITGILPPLLISDSVKSNEIKRCEQVKVPKYINTRVNEVYPARKSSERCRVLYGDEKKHEFTIVGGSSSDIPAAVSSIPSEGKISTLCESVSILKKSERTVQSAIDMSDKGFKKITKCNQNVLRSVVDLHRGDENLASFAKIDMEKALKGLVACDIPVASSSLPVYCGKIGDHPSNSSSDFCSKFEMASPRIPFDFTLKTSLRFVSSSSVKWCHRLAATSASIDIYSNPYKLGCVFGDSAQVNYSRSLHSWVHPQSSLPSSVISILASSTAKGETDFLLKREQDWEDSFRDLYYMLRKDKCKIFYVYTMQFVVLFVGGNFLEKKKHSCNAYLSQSTRGLRSLLRKHSVSFTMPLCRAEVEQATEDDLVELMEIKKRNLGQAFHLEAQSDVDNTSQSLLLFSGNREVHALYDFLLNYRFFLKSLAGSDVPMLYAPFPFKNASSHAPEVRCKEIRKADMVISSSSGSDTDDIGKFSGSVVGGLCYSIEIKDTILPPWVVCGASAVMSSEARSFISTLHTDSLSIGLNVALNSICCDKDVSSIDAFGIPQAVLTPRLSGMILQCLKYSEGVYTANLTPI